MTTERGQSPTFTPTDAQRAAVETVGTSLFVDAGAGSGKTRVLVDRVLRLLETEAAPLEGIVAITFTEKAAAEMRERLRIACRKKASTRDPERMNFWRKIERGLLSSSITTFHAYCAGILRKNALRLNLDPDFALLADAESVLFRTETINRAVGDLLDSGDEDLLKVSVEFGLRRAVEALTEMISKEGVLERIASAHPLLDAQGLVQHWQELAAQERNRRTRALCKSRKLVQLRSQLESFEGKCTKPTDGRELFRLNLIDLCDLLVSDAPLDELSAHIEEASAFKIKGTRKDNWDGAETQKTLKALEDDFKKFLKPYSALKADDVAETRTAELTCALYRAYGKVLEAFRNAKQARGALDFEDLMIKTRQVLAGDAHIREKTTRGIRHLLIDEFQDTNAVQMEIAHLLTKAGPGSGADLFVVGDAKQSIYDFRGAEVEVFQQASKDAENRIGMNVNFRTLPDVLSFINDFFKKSQLLADGNLDFHPLTPHRPPVGESRVEFLIVEESNDNKNVDDYRREEGVLIANRIAQMCAGPRRVKVGDGESERGAAYGDIAVLFRTRSSMYLYEEALRRRSIPYQTVAGRGFYERQEVSDIVNLLKVIVDPWDEPALLGFLRSPMAGLSDETLFDLCSEQGLAAAFHSDAGARDGEQQTRLAHARECVRSLKEQVELPLEAFVRLVLDTTSYESTLLTLHHGAQRASNVRKLARVAESFSSQGRKGLRAFVRYLEEVSSAVTDEGDAALETVDTGAVTLMTIHMAKGLEFPIVFIADTSRGRKGKRGNEPYALHRRLGLVAKPTGEDGTASTSLIADAIKLAEDEQDLGEHARLLYVAMTRTRDWLVISGSGDAPADSWLKTLDDTYELLEREDGDTFGAPGWRATVRHEIDEAAAERPRAARSATLDNEALLSQVCPISCGSVHAREWSVTEILGMIEEPRAHATTPFEVDALTEDGMTRGSLAHRLFELWDFIAAPEPLIHRILVHEYTALRNRDTLRAYLMNAAEAFQRSAICERLREDPRPRKEVPYILRIGEAWVRGTIDAVLSDGTIIDYKTGAYSKRSHARYERQVRLYRVALSRIADLHSDEAIIFYVDEGREEVVDTSAKFLDTVLTETRDALAQAFEEANARASGE